MSPVASIGHERLRSRQQLLFRSFATTRAACSPTYRALARTVADEPRLLAHAGDRNLSRLPELFFAAVQFLARRSDDNLTSLFDQGLPAYESTADATAAFAGFVYDHGAEIRELVRTRNVQTNEPARCVALVLALTEVRRQFPDAPVHLEDLGASAGLQMLPDYYAYRLLAGGAAHVIPRAHLACRLAPQFDVHVRGDHAGVAALAPTPIASRHGVDVAPLDCGSADDRLWLESFIHPEQSMRRRLLRACIVTAHDLGVTVERLDAVDAVENLADGPSRGGITVVVHSHMIKQVPHKKRARLEQLLAQLVRGRGDVARVAIEGDWQDAPRSQQGGRRAANVAVETRLGRRWVAVVDSHGTWVELTASHGDSA